MFVLSQDELVWVVVWRLKKVLSKREMHTIKNNIIQYDIEHSYSTIQYSTVQYSTLQYSTQYDIKPN